MKRLGRIAASVLVLAVIFAMLLSTGASAAVPEPTSQFYVNDFASVLSDDTKSYIMAQSRALDESTTAQVVVVTVESMDGKDETEYALELGRSWGVGAEGKDNGIVILLSTGDRRVRIEVGRGLEGAINDAKAGRMLDEYAVPYLRENDWNNGVRNVYSAIIGVVYEEYGMAPPEDVESAIAEEESGFNNSGISSIAVLIAIIILIIFSSIGPRRRGGFRGGGFYGGFGGGFHRGGFGGGGGFSRGGGFSGGGGSFGGGGAGRGF